MDITPLLPKGRQNITGYGGGGFKINQEFVADSLLVFAEEVLQWEIAEGTLLTTEHLQPVFGRQVEFLLIGTGSSIQPISAELRAALKAAGIATDVMDTGAACRTYNVLLSEGRRVAAAVIAV